MKPDLQPTGEWKIYTLVIWLIVSALSNDNDTVLQAVNFIINLHCL